MLDHVVPIPAFTDNYIWAFTDARKERACVVDPGDAEPVLAYLDRHSLRLTDILITHHHADHTGGVSVLAERFSPTIFGPAHSPFKLVTQRLQQGDEINVFDATFGIFEVPGHTLDHIAYYCDGNDAIKTPLLFCGDTLFSSGCGRLFEGSPDMMYTSLQKLAALPATTRVFCTHEYTLANLQFANAADPHNPQLQKRTVEARQMRKSDQPTLPSSIGLELAVNPFLRCDEADLVRSASTRAGEKLSDPRTVFAHLRQWKDNFRG